MFDVGHGTASFSFATMRQARSLGVVPYTISTDIYCQNIRGPVHSLAMTMTKFLALGFPLEEVVAAATTAPAAVLRLGEELGTLRVSTVADISILQLTDRVVSLIDSEQAAMTSEQVLEPRYTIKSGKVLKCK
ncbi:amidohydrolase family protein [Brevibacillus humidisoli]|uniref:amidohydrolase family protein n=1 Tax=Brevibacillus humidisoli TaxID=2895522 RepID=UPI001E4D53E0|nr:amidohydrolase family protein [Brevibacillus humidisoli]UFJ39107.1 amidohydrolase family protein [Brevibacillus humidisoli]